MYILLFKLFPETVPVEKRTWICLSFRSDMLMAGNGFQRITAA